MSGTAKEMQRWLEWVQTTSVALRREEPSGGVGSSASGCLVQYSGRRFVVTAGHAVPGTGWCVEIGFDAQVGDTEIWRLRGFSFVGEMRKGQGLAGMRMFDCCFEEVSHSVQPVFEHRTPRGVFSERRLRPVFITDLTALPQRDQQYAFAGEIKPEKHGNNWMADHATYPGLTYLHSDAETHTFKLPVTHPGHDEFRGCSGAPIVGEDGEIVAIVLSGETGADTIKGLSLAYVKPALDLYCASVPSLYGSE